MIEHRHRWVVDGFRWADDRPLMDQSCACGVRRSVAAWYRLWTPPARPAATNLQERDA
jgi:hypothetical protein